MSTQAFTIHLAQSTLDELRERLGRTRWPDEVEGAGWDYGTNVGYLKELVDYWQHTFDWRAQEARLNHFAQFRTQIDGVHIHFVHERARQGSGQAGHRRSHADGTPALACRFPRLSHDLATVLAVLARGSGPPEPPDGPRPRSSVTGPGAVLARGAAPGPPMA